MADEKLKKSTPKKRVTKSKNLGGARPGAGRKKGGMNAKTKEAKIVEEELRNRVLKHANKILNAHLNVALGATYMYRIDETEDSKGRKIRKHVLVTDPDEIQAVLDDTDGIGTSGDDYYYITTDKPDIRAIDSLFDRTFGKPASKVELDANIISETQLDDEQISTIAARILDGKAASKE